MKKLSPLFLFTALSLILIFSTGGSDSGSAGGNFPLSPDSKQITSFGFANPASRGIIDETKKTVTVTVPFGTDLSTLAAVFTTSGAKMTACETEQTSGITENDFSGPVPYTVTAEDGTTREYTVNVTAAKSSAKKITSFSIDGQNRSVVNKTTITVVMPFDTDLTSLSPSITHTGASISPEPGIAVDFTSPVTYTVMAVDGSKKDYTVRVNLAPYSWIKTVGGSGDDIGSSICHDRSGNVYVTGYFSGTADFGGINASSRGAADAFIVKYSPEGACLWLKTFGGDDEESDAAYGNTIAADAHGNIYAAGSFAGTVNFDGDSATAGGDSDIYIIKYDTNGKRDWVKTMGGVKPDDLLSICTDISGSICVTGFFGDTVNFGGGDVSGNKYGTGDIFIAKYSPRGNLLWVKTAGGPGQDQGYSICTDSAGDIYATGWFTGPVSFGDEVRTSNGSLDVFIVKYSSDGMYQWGRTIGGRDTDFGASICTDRSNSVYVTGSFMNNVDFGNGTIISSCGADDIYIAKYDRDGAFMWVKTAGGSASDTGYSICADLTGNLYVTGYFSGSADFGSGNDLISTGEGDIFIARYLSSDGSFQQAKHYGGTGSAAGDNYGFSICTDSSGNVYATGSFAGTADFSANGRTSAGGWDLFIIRN